MTARFFLRLHLLNAISDAIIELTLITDAILVADDSEHVVKVDAWPY